MRKFMLKGVGKPFDGLVVSLFEIDDDHQLDDDPNQLFEIERVESPHTLFGAFSLPIANLWVAAYCLDPYEDPADDEYDTENPYGKFVAEQRVFKGDVTVVMTTYERAAVVKVSDQENTLYSGTAHGEEQMRGLREVVTGWDDLDTIIFGIKKALGTRETITAEHEEGR